MALADGIYDLRPYSRVMRPLRTLGDAVEKGRYAAVVSLLEGYLRDRPQDRETLPLRFLLGYALQKSGQTSRALAHYLAALQYAPLASHAAMILANYYRKSGDLARALELYARVAPDSYDGVNALLARAELLVKQGRDARAIPILKTALGAAFTNSDKARAMFWLGEILVKQGQSKEAARILLRLWRRYNTSSYAEKAEELLRKLKSAPGLHEQVELLLKKLSRNNRSSIAKSLKALRRRYRAKRFRSILLYAEAELARRRSETRKNAIESYKRALANLGDDGRERLRAQITYGLAKVLSRSGDKSAALTRLLELVGRKSAPAELRAKALSYAAEIHKDSGDATREREALQQLLAFAPRGSVRRDAYWALAWNLYRAGRYDDAIARLDDLIRGYPKDYTASRCRWAERAYYWKARALGRSGRRDDAISVYLYLIERYPLTYYSNQAYNRVRELAPARLEGLRKPTRLHLKGTEGLTRISRFRIRRHAELDSAVALLRLGLTDLALRDLSFRFRQGRLPQSGQMLISALYLKKGDFWRAHRVLKWIGRFDHYPEKRFSEMWELAFPRGFWKYVEKHAKLNRISPWLILAVIRHESGFREDVVSYADAIGLMQLLVGSARSLAEKVIKLRTPTEKLLKVPEFNIALGARFLRELLSNFHGNLAMVLAAYNAGPGASRRWWRLRKEMPTDEWVEEIPYTQANGYTKKVIASYAVYRYLYASGEKGRESFELSQRLPTDLGPYMKPKEGDDEPIRFEKATRDAIRKLYPKKKKRKRVRRRRKTTKKKGKKRRRRRKRR